MIRNWLKRKVQIASANAAQEDLERFIASLRGASDEELGMLIATATPSSAGQSAGLASLVYEKMDAPPCPLIAATALLIRRAVRLCN